MLGVFKDQTSTSVSGDRSVMCVVVGAVCGGMPTCLGTVSYPAQEQGLILPRNSV